MDQSLAAISPFKQQLLQEDLELEELIKQNTPTKMGPLILAELARVADKGFCGPEYLAFKLAEKQEQSEQAQSISNSPLKKGRLNLTTALVSSDRRQIQQDEAKLFSIVRRCASPSFSPCFSFPYILMTSINVRPTMFTSSMMTTNSSHISTHNPNP